MMNKRTCVKSKYIAVLLCITLISCIKENKVSQQKNTQQQRDKLENEKVEKK
jgi:hypothetical protein